MDLFLHPFMHMSHFLMNHFRAIQGIPTMFNLKVTRETKILMLAGILASGIAVAPARAQSDSVPKPAAPAGKSQTAVVRTRSRSEEHTSELQSRFDLVCRLLLEKNKGRCLRLSGRAG